MIAMPMAPPTLNHQMAMQKLRTEVTSQNAVLLALTGTHQGYWANNTGIWGIIALASKPLLGLCAMPGWA